MKIWKDVPEHLFWLAAFTIIALAYGYVGNGDYVEAVKAHGVYCDNVARGAWPNYNEADCDGL